MGNDQSQITEQEFTKLWEKKETIDHVTIWQNKLNPSIKLEEWEVPDNGDDRLQRIYQLRQNNPYVVYAFELKKRSQGICNCGRPTKKIFLERIPVRLSNLKDIPYPDILHVYDTCFKGYYQLKNHAEPFAVDEDQIGVNEKGRVKVWLNSAFQENHPLKSGIGHDEHLMVRQILDIVKKSTDLQTVPLNQPPIHQYLQAGQHPNGLTFEFVEDRLFQYAKTYYRSEIPRQLRIIKAIGGVQDILHWCRNNKAYGYTDSGNRLAESVRLQQKRGSANFYESSAYKKLRENGELPIKTNSYQSGVPPEQDIHFKSNSNPDANLSKTQFYPIESQIHPPTVEIKEQRPMTPIFKTFIPASGSIPSNPIIPNYKIQSPPIAVKPNVVFQNRNPLVLSGNAPLSSRTFGVPSILKSHAPITVSQQVPITVSQTPSHQIAHLPLQSHYSPPLVSSVKIQPAITHQKVLQQPVAQRELQNTTQVKLISQQNVPVKNIGNQQQRAQAKQQTNIQLQLTSQQKLEALNSQRNKAALNVKTSAPIHSQPIQWNRGMTQNATHFPHPNQVYEHHNLNSQSKLANSYRKLQNSDPRKSGTQSQTSKLQAQRVFSQKFQISQSNQALSHFASQNEDRVNELRSIEQSSNKQLSPNIQESAGRNSQKAERFDYARQESISKNLYGDIYQEKKPLKNKNIEFAESQEYKIQPQKFRVENAVSPSDGRTPPDFFNMINNIKTNTEKAGASYGNYGLEQTNYSTNTNKTNFNNEASNYFRSNPNPSYGYESQETVVNKYKFSNDYATESREMSYQYTQSQGFGDGKPFAESRHITNEEYSANLDAELMADLNKMAKE